MPSSNTQMQLTYQVCPIILTGGIASDISGGALPLLSILYPGGDANTLPANIPDLDDAFGAFNVLVGGNLILQQIGQYPFANQSVAANAVIRQPLTLSVIMDAPMRGPNAWQIKQQVFTALKQTLDNHNFTGGTYTISTPAYQYENMVMISLTDSSRGNSSLPQNAWRFDFEKPLVALTEALTAFNNLATRITNGTVTDGSQSGPQPPSQTNQPALQQTIPTVGGLIGSGSPGLPLISGSNFNYPPVPSAGGFPFSGVS